MTVNLGLNKTDLGQNFAAGSDTFFGFLAGDNTCVTIVLFTPKFVTTWYGHPEKYLHPPPGALAYLPTISRKVVPTGRNCALFWDRR